MPHNPRLIFDGLVLINKCDFFILLCACLILFSKLSDYGVVRTSETSISVSESIIVNVSGASEDADKEAMVSWNLQVNCLFVE